jgi:NADPH-dependent curcumin reductase CurA
MIADYNTDTPAPGPSWLDIIRKRLTIQGFTLPDHQQEFPAMIEQIATFFMTGQLKYRTQTLKGLQSAIEGINLLFNGGNEGKLMVEL